MTVVTNESFLNFGFLDDSCDVTTGRQLDLGKVQNELLRLATRFKSKYGEAPTHVGLHPEVADLEVPESQGIKAGKLLIRSVNGLLSHLGLTLIKQRQPYKPYIWIGHYRKMKEAASYAQETGADVAEEYNTMIAEQEFDEVIEEATEPTEPKTSSFEADVTYDEETMELTIVFTGRKNKRGYTYLFVPLEIVNEWFADEANAGQFYNSRIKGIYPTTTLTLDEPEFKDNGASMFIGDARPETLEAALGMLVPLCQDNGVEPTHIILWESAKELLEHCQTEGYDVLKAYGPIGRVWCGVPARPNGG